MKKNILLSSIFMVLVLIYSGCRTLGVRTHFDRDLSKIERDNVVFTNKDDSLASIKNDGRVYAITGSQLAIMLQNTKKAMVYQWDPFCKSENCHSLSALQYFCDKHDMELFVVADYYYGIFTQNTSLASHPVFIANEQIYGTDSCQKLEMMFYGELLGDEMFEKVFEKLWYRYIYFENGVFKSLCLNPFDELR